MRTKPPGQDMQEEATQELLGLEGHDTLFSAVPIISASEADVFAVEGGDAVVRYGHAVGITAEIAEDMFGSAEGRYQHRRTSPSYSFPRPVVRTSRDRGNQRRDRGNPSRFLR